MAKLTTPFSLKTTITSLKRRKTREKVIYNIILDFTLGELKKILKKPVSNEGSKRKFSEISNQKEAPPPPHRRDSISNKE